jgi:hypothetical protein
MPPTTPHIQRTGSVPPPASGTSKPTIQDMGRLAASVPLALLVLVGLGGCQIRGLEVQQQQDGGAGMAPFDPEQQQAALPRCDTSHEARDQIAKKAVRTLWETGDFQVIEVRVCRVWVRGVSVSAHGPLGGGVWIPFNRMAHQIDHCS